MNKKSIVGIVASLALSGFFLSDKGEEVKNNIINNVPGTEYVSMLKNSVGLANNSLEVSDEVRKDIYLPIWGESSFYSAKVALKDITKKHGKTFYCNCDIKYISDSKLIPLLNDCGFKFRKNQERANRMEAEHIVPISWYGKNLSCWKEGGRSNCEAKSEIFNLAEADLVNLQYAIGEVNGDRSNYKYDDWNSKPNQYGSCDAKVDFSGRRFQPRDEIHGWIGRVHIYMQQKYNFRIGDKQNEKMLEWAKEKPTQWECEYNDILKSRYGKDAGNYLSTYACDKLRSEQK